MLKNRHAKNIFAFTSRMLHTVCKTMLKLIGLAQQDFRIFRDFKNLKMPFENAHKKSSQKFCIFFFAK